MKATRTIKRLTEIWSNSLLTFAILGILSLFLANFVQRIYIILLLGQLMSIVSFSMLFFQSFMMLILGKSKSLVTVFILLGSGGTCIGLIGQMMQNQIMDKPPVLHISGVFISVAIIVFNNKNYFTNG